MILNFIMAIDSRHIDLTKTCIKLKLKHKTSNEDLNTDILKAKTKRGLAKKMTGMINTIKDAFPTFEDEQDGKKWYFVSKFVLSSVRKICSSDQLVKYIPG